MAFNTCNKLFVTLVKAYADAFENGRETVELSMGMLAEVLEYLDGKDVSKEKIYPVALDDQSPTALLFAWHLAETPRAKPPVTGPDKGPCDGNCGRELSKEKAVYHVKGAVGHLYLCKDCKARYDSQIDGGVELA